MKKALFALLSVVALGVVFAAGSWIGWRSATAGNTAATTQKALYYSCPMHPAYHTDRPGDCPSCGMRLEPVYADEAGASHDDGGTSATRLPGAVKVSPERQQAIGVQVGEAARKPVTHVIRTSGRVAADETRVYRVTAASSGWIETALTNSVGSLVRKDELLGTFYAREFLSTQQAYFYALDARDRFVAQNASEAQMTSTNTQIQQSADALRALGMTSMQIEELGRTRQRTYTVEIRAPAAGFVLVRNISPGQRFEAGTELYVIGDLGRVWILADVFEHEARWLHPRDQVRVVYQGETFSAVVSDVLPVFDPEALTMKVRLDLSNPGYRFRPGMFVDVEFPLSLQATLTVPASAVVDSGRRKTVFVDRGNGYFEPRSVETGWRLGDQIEILSGLMAGERVVISGTFLIDSESRMKAAAQGVHGPAAKDLICGMDVDEKRAAAAGRTSEYKGTTYYFCSDDCKKEFDKTPEKYGAK
jgi:RND family efflux transporter MFP subunit